MYLLYQFLTGIFLFRQIHFLTRGSEGWACIAHLAWTTINCPQLCYLCLIEQKKILTYEKNLYIQMLPANQKQQLLIATMSAWQGDFTKALEVTDASCHVYVEYLRQSETRIVHGDHICRRVRRNQKYYRGPLIDASANQKQELSMSVIFVNGSERKGEIL